MTLFATLAHAHQTVAADSKRNAKVAALAAALAEVADDDPSEIPAATAYLYGDTFIGRIGVGWAAVGEVGGSPAVEPSLTISEVTDALGSLATTVGSGSQSSRAEQLDTLFAKATAAEADLLRGILLGDLRQGALEGVVMAAVAKATNVPLAALRRASMFLGSLPEASFLAAEHGRSGLDAVSLRPGIAVQPMLASTSESATAALEAAGTAALVQWKFDGIRIQAHRHDDEVRLFTRNLNDITDRLPNIVSHVRALPGGDLVLDGEAMGDNPFWFDVLMADGVALIDAALAERRKVLSELVPSVARVPEQVAADGQEAEKVLVEAVAAGHEGVVVKDLDSTYEAGRRGKSWRKVKPVHTFDLVVLAVEWGHGRRTGWLSNLHLGARTVSGEFLMVGKTFKGMTDELLAWQTERFLELETHRSGHVVHVEPVQVVEVAVDGVHESTRYDGGLALRFARVKGYRHDKQASEADTLGTLRALMG